MSHRITVPLKRGLFRKRPIDLQDVLAGVPRAVWLSGSVPLHLPIDHDVLIGCDGAARGVALTAREDGVVVRLFTCASRADVDLAVDLVASFMRAGSGTANDEEGTNFEDVRELFAHYDETRRAGYVAWGPHVVTEHVTGEDAISLSGPWCAVTLAASDLRAWREKGGDFSARVVDYMVASQTIARAARRALEHGPIEELHRLVGEPTREAACTGIAQWIEESWADPALRARACERLGALPPALLGDGRVLFCALRLLSEHECEAANSDAALADRVRVLASACACRDPHFAIRVAGEALGLAQKGSFAAALVLFDAVVEWPRLPVPAQGTWMGNALWAVQADNNKLRVDAARARRYVTLALAYGPANPAIFFNAACVSSELGDHERALSLISLAAHHRYPHLAAITREPLFEPLRRDPRFEVAMAGRL